MSFKIREEHVQVIADFMEEHTDLARGRLSCSNAKEQFRKLWAELANSLNSLGFGERTVEKWQRTWSDYKLNLKKRASEISSDQRRTGGGRPLFKVLSDTDSRILNILGKTFFEGCGTEEKGLEILEGNLPKPERNVNKESMCSTLPSKSFLSQIEVEPSTSGSTSSLEKRKLENDDHDYLATSRFGKRKKRVNTVRENETMNMYYEQTMNILLNINTNIQNIHSTFKSIDSTIDKKLTELCEILKNRE